MMKKLRQWLPPLFALLLTAAGAALPYMAAAAQDAQVGNMRENRLLDAVDLTLRKAGDARDMLKLAAGPNMELLWDGATRLTAEEAASAARELVDLAVEAGIIAWQPEQPAGQKAGGPMYDVDIQLYGGVAVEPYLMVSEEESSLSGVLWSCWGEGLPPGQIVVDDASGKMVQMILNTETPADSDLKFSAAALAQARSWAEFLSGYYDVALTVQEQEDHPAKLYAEYSLTFPYGESLGTCRMTLEGWNSLVVCFNL